MASFICLGTPPFASKDLTEIAAASEPSTWTIHSLAKKGDKVFFYFRSPKSAIVATGVVAADPKKVTDARKYWYGRFMAPIGEIDLLAVDLPHQAIRRAFPSWGYWSQPRLSTQIPDRHVGKLRALIRDIAEDPSGVIDVDEQAMATEGRGRWIRHFRRERSAGLRKKKRHAVLQLTKKLLCEACDFDFAEKYGELGEGFCEIHHDRPIATGGVRVTKLSELSILCSNCHRMVHHTQPMLRVRALRKRITS